MSQRLLSAAEAAGFLGVKKTTIYSLTKSGELPVFIIGAKHFRYDPADLERYIASRRGTELLAAASQQQREAGLIGQQRRREAAAA